MTAALTPVGAGARAATEGTPRTMADEADRDATSEPSGVAGTPSAAAAYDASAIEVLEGLEAVRKRPGMYIGSTGSAGLVHLLWEIIDNAVDEAAAGHGRVIDITLHGDGSYEVTDRGRGIPVDVKHDNITALEVVFTELHAGGKFGNGAYGASGGLHGVGASVVNALSSKLVVDVNRNGATHRLEFKDRIAGHTDSAGRFRAGHKLKRIGRVPAGRTGTRVQFWPDTGIFDPAAEVDFDEVRERIEQVCFLVPKVKITLADRRADPPVVEEIVSAGGLADFVDKLCGDDEPVTGLIRLTGSEEFTERVPVDGKLTDVVRQCEVEVALRWTQTYSSRIVGFCEHHPDNPRAARTSPDSNEHSRQRRTQRWPMPTRASCGACATMPVHSERMRKRGLSPWCGPRCLSPSSGARPSAIWGLRRYSGSWPMWCAKGCVRGLTAARRTRKRSMCVR